MSITSISSYSPAVSFGVTVSFCIFALVGTVLIMSLGMEHEAVNVVAGISWSGTIISGLTLGYVVGVAIPDFVEAQNTETFLDCVLVIIVTVFIGVLSYLGMELCLQAVKNRQGKQRDELIRAVRAEEEAIRERLVDGLLPEPARRRPVEIGTLNVRISRSADYDDVFVRPPMTTEKSDDDGTIN